LGSRIAIKDGKEEQWLGRKEAIKDGKEEQ
jgi:hypothetical protein